MSPYLRIARVDHWIKNIFVIPGLLSAFVLGYAHPEFNWLLLAIGFASICAIVSANYTINEFLDREFDRFHPTKRHRAGAQGDLKAHLVWCQYALLALAGLALAALVNRSFQVTAALLLLMGLLYNVEPVRTKDRVYLDVLSESINNPLRFLLGWFLVTATVFPPSSILISYWMGGAFLMAVKRYSEYRMIGDAAVAGSYRRSFRKYTEDKLLLSSIFYALNSVFFLGVFLIKYRIEFLLSFPLFAVLFVWYLRIGLKGESAAQAPEKLYRERRFMAYVAFLAIAVLMLFFIDIPVLRVLQEPTVR